MISKFHNRIHDSKGHKNKINTIVKGREMFYATVLVPAVVKPYMFLKDYPLTMILKQKASPKYWCLNIHDISLCIKPALCTVLSAIHILTGCETTSKVGTKLCAFKPTAVHLLSEFGKSLSSPIPFKMKSYAKLSNNLLKYSNPTEHVLLWRILGMKYIIKVRFDLHLHFLRCTTYIQTH